MVHRKDGGKHGAENILTVCSGHHRMFHEGTLHVEVAADGSFAFDWPKVPDRP